jgi:hypothetical protein
LIALSFFAAVLVCAEAAGATVKAPRASAAIQFRRFICYLLLRMKVTRIPAQEGATIAPAHHRVFLVCFAVWLPQRFRWIW